EDSGKDSEVKAEHPPGLFGPLPYFHPNTNALHDTARSILDRTMTERFEDSAPDVASKQRRIRRTAADIAKNKRTDAAAIAEFALNHRIKENRRSSDPSHTKRLARHISQLRYAQTDGLAELPLAAVVDLTRSFTPSEWMAIENSPDQFRRAMEFYGNQVLELDATWMTS
ncbi:hypothetical protein D7B24_004391, partial [Verticillium nonalfalfae]